MRCLDADNLTKVSRAVIRLAEAKQNFEVHYLSPTESTLTPDNIDTVKFSTGWLRRVQLEFMEESNGQGLRLLMSQPNDYDETFGLDFDSRHCTLYRTWNRGYTPEFEDIHRSPGAVAWDAKHEPHVLRNFVLFSERAAEMARTLL